MATVNMKVNWVFGILAMKVRSASQTKYNVPF